MNKILLLLTMLVTIGSPLFSEAQSGKISGEVNDGTAPLPYATIALKAITDSSLVKTALTDDKGKYELNKIPDGKYWVEASFVGMLTAQSEVVTLKGNSASVPAITMSANAELAEVEITAEKRLIEVLADRTVFNVEKSLSATGSSALELLRKAPGVILTNDNQLMVEGKSGVQIYINGKATVLAGEDLINFLNSLQATDLEAIEIITQPSSRFDAAGNAGIINLKLKREKGLGTNGTLNAGYGYGRNGRYNGGLSLNHRDKKSNLYTNYSTAGGKSWRYIYLDRIQQGQRFNSQSETLNNDDSHNVRLGYDRFIHPFHTVGVLFTGSRYQSDGSTLTTTPISQEGSSQIDQTLIANNREDAFNYNVSGNINYVFADTSGHELLIDADYGEYHRDNESFQPNLYVQGENGNVLAENNYRMETITDITVITAKADYSTPFKKGTLSFGVKYSQVETNNDFRFYDEEAGVSIFSTERSNVFDYTENINAAYVNYRAKVGKKWSYQAGLRAEQTVSRGELTSTQQNDDDLVERNYLNWFPSGGLTYRPSHKHSFAFTASRRIQRPNYQTLNPFESQLTELSFRRGNPFLQPQYTTNLKLSHTHKYRVTTSISYSAISDFFAQITDTIGATQNFIVTRNIANQNVYSASFSYPKEIKKWWNVYMSLTATYADYKGTDASFIPIEQLTGNGYLQSTFSLPKGYQFEVSGWFSTPSIWGGTYLTQSMGSLDLALQKRFMKDRLSARLAFTDVFFTQPWRADMRYGDLYINGTGGWESRRIRFNLSYNFGQKDVKASRKRDTGSSEEADRIN